MREGRIWYQTPRKLVGFHRTKDRYWSDFADTKHDYTQEFYLPTHLLSANVRGLVSFAVSVVRCCLVKGCAPRAVINHNVYRFCPGPGWLRPPRFANNISFLLQGPLRLFTTAMICIKLSVNKSYRVVTDSDLLQSL